MQICTYIDMMCWIELKEASAAMEAKRAAGTAARYDAPSGRLVVSLHNGVELAVRVRLVEDLADADPADLAEINSADLGLHWPRINADVYVPGLMAGALGSRAWMARELGAGGRRTTSPAKAAAAARANGAKGGRPRKQTE